MKRIDYFGHILDVPDWAEWIAFDANGSIYTFEEQPLLRNSRWSHGAGLFSFVTLVGDNKDWKRSLKEIKTITIGIEVEDEEKEVIDWVEWNGGECPVDRWAMVEVKLKDGSTFSSEAKHIPWGNVNGGGIEKLSAIVAYRVVRPLEPNKIQLESEFKGFPPADVAPHIELQDSLMHTNVVEKSSNGHIIEPPNQFMELTVKSSLSTQVGGSHYKDMAIQPVEFIHKNGIGYMEGCAIKYLARWKNKNGVEDLKKARHYIDLLIEMESK